MFKYLFTPLVLISTNLLSFDMGALLFHGNCITCHFEHKAVSAPSITEIQRRYKAVFPKKEDFVDYMTTWVVKPNAKTSIMLDAVKKYELMPELGYDEDTLRQISEYIFDNDFLKKHEGHIDPHQ
ncbi:MAG: cytochrome C [Thiovulaceae bacterium]|nr:cytochrome C [Sulfurimonadaceae bacterium]MCW9026760.1 cytochrome C [Sulfurimonadaceae bacterium]